MLVDHFFRHEYGTLVATLSRRVGVEHIDEVEDAAQSALMAALTAWRGGVPDRPSAWLHRVAHNALMSDLRKKSGRLRLLAQRGPSGPTSVDPAKVRLPSEVRDDLLRMLLWCCDDAIPEESQRVLALKTLCGFGVREIAQRLFISEANVYKRLGRARARLRQRGRSPALDGLDEAQVAARLPAVHSILYSLFTEGYLSSHAQLAIRRELCDEALRLGGVLAEHPAGRGPQTAALMALMHLHAARMTARQDGSGGLLLLEEQDRTQWDPQQIHTGLRWLARSAHGDALSRYHAEAGIAAEHCLAPSFEQTRWETVVEYYALLERVAPSALHRLNRAVATAEWRGPAAGLAVLEGFEPPTWLRGSYLWSAVLADLHRRCGHAPQAERLRRVALESAPTEAIEALLRRRLGT